MCSMLPSSGTKCLLTSERAHSWRKGQAEAEPRPRGLFPRAASDPHCILAAEQMARKSQGDHEDPPPGVGRQSELWMRLCVDGDFRASPNFPPSGGGEHGPALECLHN